MKKEKELMTEVENHEPYTAEFQIGNETFIYDFNEITYEQKTVAETLFRIWDKMLLNTPTTPNELNTIMERESKLKAVASLLIKVDSNGERVQFEAKENPAIKALKKLKGKENFNKIDRITEDFFYNTQIILQHSIELYKPYLSLISELQKTTGMSNFADVGQLLTELENMTKNTTK
jgi:hypothetical protein